MHTKGQRAVIPTQRGNHLDTKVWELFHIQSRRANKLDGKRIASSGYLVKWLVRNHGQSTFSSATLDIYVSSIDSEEEAQTPRYYLYLS